MIRALTDVLKERKIPYSQNVLASTLCTFRIGGTVRLLIEPQCIGELVCVADRCTRLQLPYAVIGRGSNILFGDGCIETVLIRTVALDAVRILENGRICADCGVSLSALTLRAASAGLGGLAFACGIPGTVGGALYMNAGAHGSSILDLVESVLVWDAEDGNIKTLFNDKLNNSYRNSIFQEKKMLVLQTVLQLKTDCDPQQIHAQMRALQERRRATQPIGMPSAGSTFRRPSPEICLSKILDDLGLKGMQVGGAAVSPKHAGFIVNNGGATARDVRLLVERIQNIVEREKGFRPIPEIRLIPEDS